MDINKTDNFIQKHKAIVPTPESEAALELLCDIYDLYDAQRWLRHFITKIESKNFENLFFHLEESVFILDELIRNYSNSMDELMKEKTEHYKKLRANLNTKHKL